VITNTATLPPFTVGIGKGNYPEVEEIKRLLAAKTAGLVSLDAMTLAREAGSPMSVNIVLLGALIQTGALGFTKENVIEAIRRRTKPSFLEKNLKAFELGMEAAKTK
jgi:indolepyruvate ferredoxin oxidoreductase beta subunit